jgi:hypothetical protein
VKKEKVMKHKIQTATLKTTYNNYPAGTYLRIEHDTNGIYRCWASFSKKPETFLGDVPKTILMIN